MNTESGTPMRLEECRRCGEKDVDGMAWWWEGGREFKCDRCGRTMLLGFDEATNKKQVEGKEGYEKSVENRGRYFRELDVQFGKEWMKATEALESTPDVIEHFKPLLEGVDFTAQEQEKMERDLAGKNKFADMETAFTPPKK